MILADGGEHVIGRCRLNPQTLLDVEALSEMLRGRPTRRERHAARLQEEEEELERESRRHGDIVFVDVVDTYRNVPSKLLQFYKWYASSGRSRGLSPSRDSGSSSGFRFLIKVTAHTLIGQ